MVLESVANIGRAAHVEQVQRSLAVARLRTIGARRAFVEVDEGDHTKPGDHVLLERAFRRAQKLTWESREVALLPKRVELDERFTASVFGCAALENQTPRREWHTYREHETRRAPGRTTIYGHPPAGARNGAGSRRSKVTRLELNERYDAMMDVLDRLLADADTRGDDVVIKGDFNDPNGLQRMRDRQVAVTKSGPDGIYAIPAKGRGVHVRKTALVPLYIESMHKLHVARFSFV